MKIECEVDVPLEINLEHLRWRGPQEGEELVPKEVVDKVMGGVEVATSTYDKALVGQLMDMGFGSNGCLCAIAATGGGDAPAATTWIFEHSCNKNFNVPVPIS